MTEEGQAEKLVRWGFDITMGAPSPDPSTMTAEELEAREGLCLDIERMKAEGIVPDFPD